MFKVELNKDGYFQSYGLHGDIYYEGDLDELTEFHKYNKESGTFSFDTEKHKAYVLANYATLRAPEYDTLSDQMDEIMKWLATETEFQIPEKLKSIAMRQMAVKSKYPKK